MEPKSREEIVEKAIKAVAPVAQREEKRIKGAIENIAIITTMITIGAYVVMYAYKVGYYMRFNIPAACVRVDLKDYLPLLLLIGSMSLCALWYIIELKSDQVLNKRGFNILRIFYGFAIVSEILRRIGIFHLVPSWAFFLISISLSVLIEGLICFIRRKKTRTKQKEGSPIMQEVVFENTVHSIFIHRYYIRTGIFILALASSLGPLAGQLIAEAKKDFQMFQINEASYAVIEDYGDSVISQRAIIDGDNLSINTSSYLYSQKDGIKFEYYTFDSVCKEKSDHGKEVEDENKDPVIMENDFISDKRLISIRVKDEL